MDFQKIFQSQQYFFRSQRTKSISFRKENLIKLKTILKTNEKKLYEAIFKDFSKSVFDTYSTELGFIYNEIDFYINNLPRLSRPRKVKTNLLNQPGISRIHKDPMGSTLIIGAWNYPYNLTFIPVISSMAAGNTCMIKPSELPVNTMKLIAELINNNFPEEYLFVVQGGIEETTEILKLRFDKIFFTGSPKTGKIVYEAAAKNLTPVTLELGGKSPVIVTKSANLEVAARRIVWGKFLNAGQTCIAPDYLLAEEEIKDKLMALIKDQLESAKYEEGSDQYVNIINKRNFDRVLNLINRSKICYGGNSDASTLYIEPTIMDNVSWDDAVMQEEIFGPLLPVLGIKTFDEALDVILDHDKPLSAYLFSGDNSEKDAFIDKISFGGGCINDTIMHIANGNLPFGGIGSSGIGNYHGESGFNAFTHNKSVLDKAVWGEPDLKYPPYNEKKQKWVKRIL